MIYMLSRKRCDEIPTGFFQSLLNYHRDNLYIISLFLIGFLTEKANFLVFFLRKITILWGWVFLAMARCQ